MPGAQRHSHWGDEQTGPANSLILATSATPPAVQTIVFDLQSDEDDVIDDIYEGRVTAIAWTNAVFYAFLSDTILTNVASLSGAAWAALRFADGNGLSSDFRIGRNLGTSALGGAPTFPRFFGLMQLDGGDWAASITSVELLRRSGRLRVHTTGTTYANGLDDTAP
jgi:hypothetical protein